MSVMASLKAIDYSAYVTMSILDAIDIDIDPTDGRLVFSEDPSMMMDIGGKLLRLNVGHPYPNLEYTVFNPITREDHAQFLMTLALYSQHMADKIDITDEKATDFHIKSEIDVSEVENGSPQIIETYIKNYKDDAVGYGEHTNDVISVVLAVLDYLKQIKHVAAQKIDALSKEVVEAFNEYTRMSELTPVARKNESKQKSAYLKPPVEDIEEENYFDIPEEVEEDDFVEDDPADDVDITDEDFPDSENIDDAPDFVDSDFTDQEISELFTFQTINTPANIDISDNTLYDEGCQDYPDTSPIAIPEEINFFQEDIFNQDPIVSYPFPGQLSAEQNIARMKEPSSEPMDEDTVNSIRHMNSGWGGTGGSGRCNKIINNSFIDLW